MSDLHGVSRLDELINCIKEIFPGSRVLSEEEAAPLRLNRKLPVKKPLPKTKHLMGNRFFEEQTSLFDPKGYRSRSGPAERPRARESENERYRLRG